MLSTLQNEQHSLALPPQQGQLSAIYSPHFGLTRHPFAQVPDREFYYLYDALMEVVNTVYFSLHSGEGIVKIIGEAGIGKTLLIRNIVASLGSDYFVIPVLNPHLSATGLLQAIVSEFGYDVGELETDQQLVRAVQNILFQHYAQSGTKVLLCIDDAQKLSKETLDALHLISNLETNRRKLVQVILIGQPELNQKLESAELLNIVQRITFSETIKPLTRSETEKYIQKRLKISGYDKDKLLFNRAALNTIYQSSEGVPRLINTLSHKAMMIAFGAGLSFVNEYHVKQAIRDTDSATKIPFGLPWYCFAPFLLAGFGVLALTVMG